MQDSVAAGERAGPQSAGGESLSGRPQFVRHPRCFLETGVLAGGWDEVSSVSAARTKAYEHGALWGAGRLLCARVKGRSVVAGPEGSALRGASPMTAISANAWVVWVRCSGIALLGWRAFEDGGDYACVNVVCMAGHDDVP